MFTHDFEFKLGNIIDLISQYKKSWVSKSVILSCLDDLFVKLSCFYPINIYESAKNSIEVLETISYYLDPIKMGSVTPKAHLYDYRSSRSAKNYRVKNIRLTHAIIRSLRHKLYQCDDEDI